MPRSLLACLLVLVCALSLRAETKSYPPPAPAKPDATRGARVQRTMTLLATSTPQHHNKVRILFYGQSITEQEWSKLVAADLRKRFPDADLEIENRAIGGFAAQLLIRPAEHDVYPFYPDLVIFHVYGANQEYEQIIKNIRSRTTAEVLMQKDHVTKLPPAVIDQKKDKGMWWDDLMNHHLLPDIAAKYGCGLVDVRSAWLDYLKANKLEPKDLLKDNVHLNDHGNYLLAELVKRELVYRPESSNDSWKDLVKTIPVDKLPPGKDGSLTLDFEGNRIDVIAAQPTGTSTAAAVLIDGVKPSQLAGVYRITRPTPGPWSPVTVTRVDHDQPLQLEDWTLTVTSVNPDSTEWKFDVNGSRTGPDGAGDNKTPYISKSGRVRIDPAAWFRNQSTKIPVGYQITWKVLPMFVDSYQPPATLDKTRETVTTLAQGFPNSKHTLQMQAGTPVPIRAVRVYRPAVK